MRKRKNYYWNLKNIKKEAKKYTTRTQFKKNAYSAYKKARELNILDNICSHMQPQGNKYKRMLYAFEFPDKSVYVGLTYSYEIRYKQHMNNNKEIIKKTEQMGHVFIMFNEIFSLEEIGKKENLLINKYKNQGWIILNKIKGGSLGSTTKKWNKNSILKAAQSCQSRKEFEEKYSGAYSAAKKNKILNFIYKNVNWKLKHIKYSEKEILLEAQKYKTRNEFKNKNYKIYSSARHRKLLETACSHMKNKRIWTEDKIAKEALKYNYRKEFQTNSRGAYNASRRMNILDKVCSHMKRKINKPYKKDDVLNSLKKYNTYIEFRKKEESIYNAARRFKMLDKIKEYYKNKSPEDKYDN